MITLITTHGDKMNTVAELVDVEFDPVWDKMKEKHDELAKLANAWKVGRAKAMPFVRDCMMLGFDLNFSAPYIHLVGTGDKDKFLKLVRLHRRYGYKPNIPEKGATEAMWFVNIAPELDIFVRFASTVCKRVQTGTRMVETPIYETKCEEFVGDEVLELAAPAAPQIEDTIPF